MKNILCFGDSNTHGYIAGGLGRYPFGIRWPGKLQQILGPEYHIIEEGLNGRTTIFEDPLPGRRAIDYIGPCVRSHIPLDMIIFMLGANDCKTEFHANEKDIADGMKQVIDAAIFSCYECCPAFLLISPPLFGWQKWADEFDEHSADVCSRLAPEYKKIASQTGAVFLDASKVTYAGKEDLLHLDAEGHAKLAEAVAAIARRTLG